VPGTRRGHVVVLGAGAAGGGAVAVAASLGAQVTVSDLRRERLAATRAPGSNVNALYACRDAVAQAVAEADLLVSTEQVAGMQPAGVIIDISVDPGGCIATTRPTTHDSPTYIAEGVLHFCVTNMPGGVPRTSTQALSAVLLPFVQQLTRDDWVQYARLSRGINVSGGRLVHPALTAN
jgi:alanine dehydrogenase